MNKDFQLKSGNKPSFKEMGCELSPLKKSGKVGDTLTTIFDVDNAPPTSGKNSSSEHDTSKPENKLDAKPKKQNEQTGCPATQVTKQTESERLEQKTRLSKRHGHKSLV